MGDWTGIYDGLDPLQSGVGLNRKAPAGEPTMQPSTGTIRAPVSKHRDFEVSSGDRGPSQRLARIEKLVKNKIYYAKFL